MGFDTHDLLRQAGYETGDTTVLERMGADDAAAPSTTSTTFVSIPGLLRGFVQWDELVSSDVQAQVSIKARLQPGTDETLTARVRNLTDGETVGNTLETNSNANLSTGFVDYTPTTTANPIRLEAQHKTVDGVNSSTTVDLSLEIGVQL